MMLSQHSRRHVLKGTVRVHGVVVGKPARQLRHHSLGVTQIPEGNVISFNRLHKALGHSIGLRALHRCGERTHVDRPGKGTCLSGGVAAAVVREPLNRARRGGITSKTLLDCSQHHVFNQASINAFGGSYPADRLSVTAVEGKATLTFSLFQQPISKPSEHQRRLLSSTDTRPS